MHRADVIIIGAGITGLSAALAWRAKGKKVIILEPSEQAGGSIRSVKDHQFLCELGPNTLMVSKPEVREFLESEQLLDHALDAAPHAKRRFLVHKDRLVPLPKSPVSALTFPVISTTAKLRMLAEPFMRSGVNRDESVASFFKRRIGPEAARELVGPFISGVYAGDPEKMLARFCMPSLYQMEREHGSLCLGALKRKKGGKGVPRRASRLVSWENGISQLVEEMVEKVFDDMRLSAPITSIQRELMGFVVRSPAAICEAPNLVMAAPAYESAQMLNKLGQPSPLLANCHYAPMVVVHLGVDVEAVRHPMNGFGALISRTQGLRSLGILFSSTLFPGRSPASHTLLTVFIGGATDPRALAMEDEELVRIAASECARLLGMTAPPVFRRVTRWEKAIPQYEQGHGEMIAEIEETEKMQPGLQVLGSFRGGVSLQDCILSGIGSVRD